MEGLEEFLVPYLISQAVSIVILIVAWRNTKTARGLFAVLFLWASGTNMYYGITEPQMYMDYADLALPFYRDFIQGWFSNYKHILIPIIAIGQLIIAIGMVLKDGMVRLACIGAIIFLLGIIPLMVGSAFPFSISVSLAAYLILKNDNYTYLWKMN